MSTTCRQRRRRRARTRREGRRRALFLLRPFEARTGLWPPLGPRTVCPSTGATRRSPIPRRCRWCGDTRSMQPTMALNRAYWALPGVKGTVWEHYMLVASQWPTVTQPRRAGQRRQLFSRAHRRSGHSGENFSVGRRQGPAGKPSQHDNGDYFQEEPSSCMSCHHSVSMRTDATSSASSLGSTEPPCFVFAVTWRGRLPSRRG